MQFQGVYTGLIVKKSSLFSNKRLFVSYGQMLMVCQ